MSVFENKSTNCTMTVELQNEGGESMEFYRGTVEYTVPMYSDDPSTQGAIIKRRPVFVCPKCLTTINADYAFAHTKKCPNCGAKHRDE